MVTLRAKVIIPVAVTVVLVLSFFQQNAEVDTQDDEVAYWMNRIETVGSIQALEEIDKKYAVEDENQRHEHGHEFGEALYRAEGISGFSTCDGRFGFGCYHSFFGWALVDHGLPIIHELDEACILVHGEKGLGCQHGIGHGILVELGYDSLLDSLRACRTLQWKGEVGGCSGGVFMEYNFSTMGDSTIREQVAGGELKPCEDLPDIYKPSCYFEQPAWWSALSDRDYKYVGELCAIVPTDSNRKFCYMGIGNTVAGQEVYSFEKIRTGCALMPSEESEMQCLEGAVWLVSAQPEYRDTWRDLCADLEGSYKERCLNSVNFI